MLYNMLYASDFKTFKSNLKNHTPKNFHDKGLKADISWKDYFNELLDEYCQRGSLHGLRYIREPSIPRTERFLWLGIILTFLYTSYAVVWSLYYHGADHSFTLDINPESTPIWDIPFPSVVVCSNYPIRKSVFNIAKEPDNETYRFFSQLVCMNKLTFVLDRYYETINEEFFEFIQKAAIPCKDLIVNCHWGGRKRNCCTYFKPILTPFGYCYVFNNLPGRVKYKNFRPPPGIKDRDVDDFMFWNLSYGYPMRDGKQAKLVRPLWSELAGPFSGLKFDLVDVREEWQEVCSGLDRGFKLAVHTPNENFETDAVIRVPHNEHSYIKLNPNLIYSEDNLRSIPEEERECLFEDEVRLDYFNHYTQATCRLECYIQNALQNCECVMFSARRFLGAFHHPYCNDSKLACLSNELNSILITPLVKPKKGEVYKKCMCSPTCSVLMYDYQTRYEQIMTASTLPIWAEEYNESEELNFARVSVYFSEQEFNHVNRKRTSTLGNLLGSCGGLLSLFLGFSVMSLFEVIYFAFIRPLNRMITLYRLQNHTK